MEIRFLEIAQLELDEALDMFLWGTGCTNNEIGELFDVSYSRERIHCYGNVGGGFGVKILALIVRLSAHDEVHPIPLQFL